MNYLLQTEEDLLDLYLIKLAKLFVASIQKHKIYFCQVQSKKSIDTEHLLWGLVRLAETNNLALNKLLQEYEVDLTALTNQLAQTI